MAYLIHRNNEHSYLIHYNKNHDPKTGRFTFSKIGDKISSMISQTPKIKNVDVAEEVSKKLAEKNAGITPKEASTFKTKELDSDYDEIKDIVPRHKDLPSLDYNSDDASQWPKDYVKAVDAGLKAIEKSRYGKGEFDGEPKNSSREWFVFEDQTIGYPEVAYLLSKGKSIDEIKGIVDKAKKIEEANNAYLNQYSSYQERANHYKDQPYPTFDGVFSMIDYFSYRGGDEAYEKEVINVLKDEGIIHGDFYMSNYLIHYNKNHSKANGQFISGDGDGDGITNDNAHRKYELKGGSKTAFGGQTKKEYRKKLEEDYQKQGVGKFQSRRFAMNAAFQNEVNTKGYNKRKAENAELVSKAKDALSKGDYKSYNAYCKKIVDTYRKARANEEAIKRASEIGRAAIEQSDIYGSLGVLGATLYEKSGAVTTSKIFKEINDQIDKEMK